MTTVTALIYYPIKSCRGWEVDEIEVQRMGLANDRRLMVINPDGRFLTQRDAPRLALVTPALSPPELTLSAPGMDPLRLEVRTAGPTRPVDIWKSRGVPAIDQGEAAAAWFSAWLERPARLVHLAEGYRRTINEKYAVYPDDHTGFADGYPILLASEDSLTDLNARLESPIPMNRFRPNLVVRGGGPFAEDGWTRIRIGEVELAVVKPCARCVVTTIDKETLAQSHEPLATLTTYRKQGSGVMFGQNVIPLNEGQLRLGMTVEVLEGR
ncbi:MAG: MOSC domain-containing protein [Anaerolineales bacterium]